MRIGGADQQQVDVAPKVKTPEQDVQIFKKPAKPGPTGEAVSYNQMKKSEISDAELFKAIEKANQKVMVRNTELQFSVHEKTKNIMIKVLNKDTQEVIREIPSEKILDMVANFMEIAGLYVDKEA